MSSSVVRNSFSEKITNFFRGIIVFLFLITLPLVAIYWDYMPFGVKAGFHWLRSQISHSNIQTEEPFQETPILEPAEEMQSQRIFAETKNHAFSVENNISLFPVQQVSHQQPKQAVIPVTQAFFQSEAHADKKVIQNSEIQDLEQEIQRLGANQCRLETWGKDGQLYRFSCFAIPCTGSCGFQKHFQQIAPTPEEAMKKVHRQLSDWQTEVSQR